MGIFQALIMFKGLLNRVKCVPDLATSSWLNFNIILEFYLDSVNFIFSQCIFLDRQILQKYSNSSPSTEVLKKMRYDDILALLWQHSSAYLPNKAACEYSIYSWRCEKT